jgi:hypothetical protein
MQAMCAGQSNNFEMSNKNFKRIFFFFFFFFFFFRKIDCCENVRRESLKEAGYSPTSAGLGATICRIAKRIQEQRHVIVFIDVVVGKSKDNVSVGIEARPVGGIKVCGRVKAHTICGRLESALFERPTDSAVVVGHMLAQPLPCNVISCSTGAAAGGVGDKEFYLDVARRLAY